MDEQGGGTMAHAFVGDLAARIENLKAEGLFKQEQVIASPQQGEITLENGAACINLCANNYLGLSNHPRLIEAARQALRDYGFGMSSVRFICGTQLPHKRLEKRLSDFLGMEDTILFPSCFDANTGLFESLLGPEDAVISDALNHASIIDGVRLCKAQRFRYANNDMAQLEARLVEAREARYRLIATDGVFSMDGTIADLPAMTWPRDTKRWSWSTTAMPSVSSAPPAAARPSTSMSPRGWTSSPGPWARRWAERPAATFRRAPGNRRVVASARAPLSFLQHPGARHRTDKPDRAGPAHRLHRAARPPVA